MINSSFNTVDVFDKSCSTFEETNVVIGEIFNFASFVETAIAFVDTLDNVPIIDSPVAKSTPPVKITL